MPHYISTRNKNNLTDSHNAIISGLAEDGGLYTPASIEPFISEELLKGRSYQDIALAVLSYFLNDYTKEDLNTCITNAYDTKFDDPSIVPLKKLNDCHLMELWHGPTSAFKDLALTILPHLLLKAKEMEDDHNTIAILTATSGDTGKAALSGFADVKGTAITVFYPQIGVSAVQKQQMVTADGDNVAVIAVRGNFDDCQRMVKEASSDNNLLNGLHGISISSANSINAGRLIPQIVYYCSSYAKLVEDGTIHYGEPVNFAVPTGNFGDILAGWLAKKAGLPVGKLICASNRNNVLSDFLSTGTYNANRNFYKTMSPSMDILVSSNLERMLCIASGYDTDLIKTLMHDLNTTGQFTIPDSLLSTIQQDFIGYWCDEDKCKQTIHDTFLHEHVVIDPHTAVGLAALKQYQKETGDTTPSIVLSTASPYKFSRSVYNAITGEDMEDEYEAMAALSSFSHTTIPANLSSLKNKEVRFTEVIDKEDGKARIKARLEEIAHEKD